VSPGCIGPRAYRQPRRAIPVAILVGIWAGCGRDAAPVGKTLPPLLAVSGACVLRDARDGADPDEPEPDDRNARATPEEPADLCAVADVNLARAEDAILGAKQANTTGKAAPASRPWDHRSKPARLADVARRFALGRGEIALLEKNGFVVPARLEFPTYAFAFHEIYQSEMPLYVSVDAILHAVFRGHDQILLGLEAHRLAPVLGRTLAVMHCALAGATGGYPEETARDLDLYLTVARTLLADAQATSVYPETGALAGPLVRQAKAAAALSEVELFGRTRTVDFTAFAPRGHYAADELLTPYFRAAVWLSRVELNVVSRSSRSSAPGVADARETPREAILALALADLTARSGVGEAVDSTETAWAAFGGRREDLSPADLGTLRKEAGIVALTEPRVFERLAAAIGDRFQRTARTQLMPEGTTALPVIATLLGSRVALDTAATMTLLDPKTPGRYALGAADVAYALGHDRARAHLATELARWPGLEARLDEARSLAHSPPGDDLHGLWLRGLLALAELPQGALPKFMETEAFADARISSAVVGWAELRHDGALFAGQAYDQGGCAIPDAYVDPVPAVYGALAAYADRGAELLARIDPGNVGGGRAYFRRLSRTLHVLEAIAMGELAGRALSEDERRWLSMILEMAPGSTTSSPTYTGWYFDLYPTRSEALARADFIADYATSGTEGVVSYAGARAPRLGVFVVDTGGPPRVVVGPVAHGYEHQGLLAVRLDDEAASKLPDVREPWSASYTAKAPAPPALTMDYDGEAATVTAPEAVGPVTIEVLDHHRRAIEAVTKTAGAGETKFSFKPAPDDRPIEALHLHVGAFDGWVEVGGANGTIIDTTPR
jgi:hypothetical protein